MEFGIQLPRWGVTELVHILVSISRTKPKRAARRWRRLDATQQAMGWSEGFPTPHDRGVGSAAHEKCSRAASEGNAGARYDRSRGPAALSWRP